MMPESPPTACKWLNQAHSFDEGDHDDYEYDENYANIDSVSEYTTAASDTNTPGPYSVASFPPSVDPDGDAFMPTPHMFASTSPFCVTPQNSPDPDVHHPCDDFSHFSPAKKALLLRDTVICPRTEPYRVNARRDIITLGSEDAQNDDFPRPDNASCTLSQLGNQTICDEEKHSVSRRQLSTIPNAQESETTNLEQTIDSNPSEERRMSLEEFIQRLSEDDFNEATWNELQNSPGQNDVAQNSPGQSNVAQNYPGQSDVAQNVSNNTISWATKSPNIETLVTKSTNGLGKRTAHQSIFSNLDFQDLDIEIPAKRQMLRPTQSDAGSQFKQTKDQNNGSFVHKNNNIKGHDLFSHVDNILPQRGKSSSVCQNPTHSFSPRQIRQLSFPDFGQVGQAVEEPQASSQAASTSTNSTFDHNGNLVFTDSQTSDNHTSPWFVGANPNLNHTSPWFVGTNPNLNHQKTFVTRSEDLHFETQHPATTSRIPSMEPNTPTPVLHKPQLYLTTQPCLQTSETMPDHHPHSVTQVRVQGDCEDQNFFLITENISQPTAIDPETALAFLLTFNRLPPELAAFNGEGPSSATASTSPGDVASFNGITEPQGIGTDSYLLNPPASTSSCPLEHNDFDATRLPTDAVTAQVFANNSTDNTSLYPAQVFPTPPSVLDKCDAVLIKDSNSNHRRAVHQKSTTVGELIQDTPSLMESPNGWSSQLSARVPDNDNRFNGSTFPLDHQFVPSSQSVDVTENLDPVLRPHHVPNPSLCGSAFTNPNIDYLDEPGVDVVSAFSGSMGQLDAFEVIENSLPADQIVEIEASEYETSFVCADGQSSGLQTDCTSSTVDLSDLADSVGADRKMNESGQVSVKVKQELKSAILNRLQKEGKPAIEISFPPQTHHELTEEEREKEKRRKELNRKAAANHRQKKKASKQSQQQEYDDQVKRNTELKKMMAELKKQILYYKQVLPPGLTRGL